MPMSDSKRVVNGLKANCLCHDSYKACNCNMIQVIHPVKGDLDHTLLLTVKHFLSAP